MEEIDRVVGNCMSLLCVAPLADSSTISIARPLGLRIDHFVITNQC
jgi:hypothetical protein